MTQRCACGRSRGGICGRLDKMLPTCLQKITGGNCVARKKCPKISSLRLWALTAAVTPLSPRWLRAPQLLHPASPSSAIPFRILKHPPYLRARHRVSWLGKLLLPSAKLVATNSPLPPSALLRHPRLACRSSPPNLRPPCLAATASL